MGKVKQSKTILCHDKENNIDFEIYVKWYCGDKEGYGIEVDSEDGSIADFAFGDNTIESYILSEGWYCYIIEKMTECKDIPDFVNEFELYIENGQATEKDIEVIKTMLKLIAQRDKKDYLSSENIAYYRKALGWVNESPPLWKTAM